MKKLVVDKGKCQSAQICVTLAPDVFELDADGKAQAKDQQGADEKAIQDAIDACPVNAISWVEE
ncbi:MAG: ferredoxin [Methanobacteriota archaeon]